ncbi:hypothetical protein [Nocardia sp. NPDC005366]|uniref:hypothetical protein n=1 Tax=Nocardia sp. NPDC005366 TaxID=3156878 RepID=UPI0033BE26D9
MTRDLPFDGDEAEAMDPSGDTAYRVANGVARVARGGAYVTGGALIASNGGGPDTPGGQRLDSWSTGWSGNRDPEPDLPSPVVTFPDPEPNSVPVFPARPAPVSHDHGVLAAPLPGAANGDSAAALRFGAPADDTVAGTGTDFFPGAPSFLGTDAGGSDATVPDWLSGDESGQFGDGGYAASSATLGPGFGQPDAGGFLNPGADMFGFARHHVSDPARVGELAGTVEENANQVGFGHSGFNPWAGTQPVSAADAAELFDGIGDFGVYVGVDASMSLYTELEVDFGIGPDGAYLTTEMKVEASAQVSIKTAAGTNVGEQIDNLSDWLDNKPTTGAGRTGHEQHGIGSGTTGFTGSSGTGPGASAPVPSPAPAPAPIAVSPAPVGMSAPAPAPVAVAAPAAVAAPVVATPLQTTIQPDAANSPIANVIAAPTGPSPLTAPAAAVPVLFEPVRPAPAGPVVHTPADTHIDSTYTTPSPVTKVPTTITHTIPTPTLPGHSTPDPGTVTLPGTVITTPPSVDVKPKPGTDADGQGTTAPGVTVTTQPTRPTTQPSTPNDDVTTPGTGGSGTGAGAGTTQPSVPTQTRPSVEAPTAEVPSVSVPTQPSVTHSAPTHAPIPPAVDTDGPTIDLPPVEVPTADIPTPAHTAPATPVKPLPVAPNGRPISDQLDSSHGYTATQFVPDADHSIQFVPDADHSMAVFASGGLSTGLMPDAVSHDLHAVHGMLDHTLI